MGPWHNVNLLNGKLEKNFGGDSRDGCMNKEGVKNGLGIEEGSVYMVL